MPQDLCKQALDPCDRLGADAFLPAKGRSIAAMKKNTSPNEPERTATRLKAVRGKTYVAMMARNVSRVTTAHGVPGTSASPASRPSQLIPSRPQVR